MDRSYIGKIDLWVLVAAIIGLFLTFLYVVWSKDDCKDKYLILTHTDIVANETQEIEYEIDFKFGNTFFLTNGNHIHVDEYFTDYRIEERKREINVEEG